MARSALAGASSARSLTHGSTPWVPFSTFGATLRAVPQIASEVDRSQPPLAESALDAVATFEGCVQAGNRILVRHTANVRKAPGIVRNPALPAVRRLAWSAVDPETHRIPRDDEEVRERRTPLSRVATEALGRPAGATAGWIRDVLTGMCHSRRWWRPVCEGPAHHRFVPVGLVLDGVIQIAH